ncbi:MAG: LPS export ABC transporter ATP-binding protein [Planctomycetes bacterium]|nr:LPS export ABC transporter ATP-binding protein [Planctomycetota bacterium]
MNHEPLLQVDGVSKPYGRRRVVDGVSLSVRRGEVVALLGRNGAGKSTMVEMVMGILKPDQGRIEFGGEAITGMPVHQRSRKGLGYVPQWRSVFRHLTVEESLLAVLETRMDDEGDRRAAAGQILSEYGLAQVSQRKAGLLPWGETRRLEICRAMITDPSLVILDEPFSGMDPVHTGLLQGVVRKLRDRGIGVLLTDHNVRESLNLCDRAYIMNQGRILMQGSPPEVLG